MMKAMGTELTIKEMTAVIENLNLKRTKTVNIITYILTFLVKPHISLSISFLIVNFSFLLLQTV